MSKLLMMQYQHTKSNRDFHYRLWQLKAAAAFTMARTAALLAAALAAAGTCQCSNPLSPENMHARSQRST